MELAATSLELRAALAAGEHAAVLGALCDLTVLEARCRASLDGLLADLAHVLREAPAPLPADARLEHASGARLDRGVLAIVETLLDVHRETLAREPGRLFAIFYNELYWVDAPARALHLADAPAGGERQLWRWMERERMVFEARPGAVWLRAVRPTIPSAGLPGWRIEADVRALSSDGAHLLVQRWAPGYRSGTAWRAGGPEAAPAGTFAAYARDTVQLWAAGGAAPLKTLGPHESDIQRAVFVGKGRLLLTASAREVRLWGAASGLPQPTWTGEMPVEAMPCDDGPVLLHHPDGDLLWTFDRTHPLSLKGELVKAWEMREGERHTKYRLDPRAYPVDLRLLDARTGLPRMTFVGTSSVGGTFAPDGRTFVGVTGKWAHLWDTATLAPLRVLGPHAGEVQRGLFSRDGRTVIIDASRELAAYRTDDGTLVSRRPVDGGIQGLLPCGDHVLVHDGKGWQLWDPAQDLLGPRMGGDFVQWTAASPAGDRMVSYSDGNMEGWALPEARQLFQRKRPGAPLAFHPQGACFAAGDGRIHDATTGEELAKVPFENASALSFDPTGRFLVAKQSNAFVIWDHAAKTVASQIRSGRHGDARIHWSADGRTVAVGDWDSAFIADFSSMVPPIRWRDDARAVGWQTRLSPTGATLVTGHDDGISFWDTVRGTIRRFVQVDKLVAFFAAGSRVVARRGPELIAFATEDGAELWRTALPGAWPEDIRAADTQGLLLHSQARTIVALDARDGHERYRLADALVLLHDRDVLLTGNTARDATLRAADTGAELLTLPALGGDRFALSSDRRWLAVHSGDVTVWDLSTRTKVHTLSADYSASIRFRKESTALEVTTSETPQSGNQDHYSQSVFDVATGVTLSNESWWENDSKPAPRHEVAPGVFRDDDELQVNGMTLKLPYEALVGQTASGEVVVASTRNQRVELYVLSKR
jgi:WD40 repeat protein